MLWLKNPGRFPGNTLLLVGLCILFGCGGGNRDRDGNPGKIANEVAADLTFVESEEMILVTTEAGVIRIPLNGAEATLIFEPPLIEVAVAADHSLWALSTSRTSHQRNLLLLDEPGSEALPLLEFDGPPTQVGISPDGRYVVATKSRHMPLPDGTQDHRIFLFDRETQDVEIFGSREEFGRPGDYAGRFTWPRNSSLICIHGWKAKYYILDPHTGEITEEDVQRCDDAHPSLRRWTNPATCPATEARLEVNHQEPALEIHHDDGQVHRLVEIEGWEPKDYGSSWFADVEVDIFEVDNYLFTDSCEYVVFELYDAVWIVDVETGLVGYLIDGADPRQIYYAPGADE